MVVVVVLLAVVDTDVPGFGSLSIAVLWSLNLADNTKNLYWQKHYLMSFKENPFQRNNWKV
jgi:hypothetical protein